MYGGPPPPGGYGPPPGGYGPPPGGGYGPPPPGGFGMGPPGAQMPPPMGPGFGQPQPSNGLAIASLVCGIAALPSTCCCSMLSLPLAIAAAIMGGIAISKANAQPDLYGGGKGMAIGGLICGILAIASSVIFMAMGMSQYLVDQYTRGH